MICIQCPDGTIFFPDKEIITPKPTTSRNMPAIAFKSKGTGGLQFVKRYKSREERDKEFQRLQTAAGNADPEGNDKEVRKIEEKFKARLEATEKELEEMRSMIRKQDAAQKPKKSQKTKTNSRKQKKTKEPSKDFIPPTDEEIIDYIKEREMDKKLGQPAETIAESFRDIYEKEEDTGEKDANGFSVRRIVWRKANGDPVSDWKGCLRTFKGRQLMWKGEASVAKETGKTRTAKSNQFCEFDQNEYTDEEIADIENELINSSEV